MTPNEIKLLTQEQRLDARQNARSAMEARIGHAPRREMFNRNNDSEYPAWLVWIVVALSVVVLLTSFVLSAMRLYFIGHESFYATIPDAQQAKVAGASIVILAEAASVLFTLAMSVIGKTRTARYMLMTGAFISACIALSGNFYVALWGRSITGFEFLEAMAPPVLVIITAFVLKEVALQSIVERRRSSTEFNREFAEWQKQVMNVEKHSEWIQVYASALRDAIVDANKFSKPTKEAMKEFTNTDWSFLVHREFSQERWYDASEFTKQPVNEVSEQSEQPVNSGRIVNAREIAHEYFKQHPEHVGIGTITLDKLVPIINKWAGSPVSRTSIHNVRKELQSAMYPGADVPPVKEDDTNETPTVNVYQEAGA